LEFLFIFVVFALYKIYSISKSEITQDYLGDNTELNLKYKDTKTIKQEVTPKNKKKLEKLKFETITSWLENPSQNRNYYSLSIINSILFCEDKTVTNIALNIQKELINKKVEISIEKIYENINRLWKNGELEKNYIEIENNSFTYSFDITEKEFVILDSLFKSSMKDESNFSWNNYRIIKDLNYLFIIIPKSKSKEFI
jgi:hypothetical protein